MSIFKYFGKKPDSDTRNEKDGHPSQTHLPSTFGSGLGSKRTRMSYQMLSTLRTLKQLALQMEGSVEKDSPLLIILVRREQNLESMQLKMATRKPENIFQRIFPT